MKSKLTVIIILFSWAAFIAYVIYGYSRYGSDVLSLFIPKSFSEVFSNTAILELLIASGITGYLINERRKLFKETQLSEKKYQDLVDNALVGIYKTNLKGNILYANKALAKIFEFESPEKLRQSSILLRYKNPEDREVLIENLKKTGRLDNYELELLTKTGKSIIVLVNATLEGDTLSGMMMDISERRKFESALKDRVEGLEEFYDMAVERELKMIELKDEIKELEEELRKYKA